MEVIVANSGIQLEQPARALAEFGRLARRFDLNGTKSICADTGQQLAAGGLCDVKAIEQSHGLISFRTSDVRLSVHVLHDAGDEVEHVAIVMRGGIRDVEDVESAEGLLRGNLSRIDGGRRFDHIDYLAHLLLVRKSDIDVRRSAGLDRRQHRGIETLFFDAELVSAGGQVGELAVAGKIGDAAQRNRLRSSLQKYERRRYSNIVFIVDRDQDVLC